MMTSDNVHNITIKKSFFGYNVDEVDDLLEQVEASLSAFELNQRDLNEKVEKLKNVNIEKQGQIMELMDKLQGQTQTEADEEPEAVSARYERQAETAPVVYERQIETPVYRDEKSSDEYQSELAKLRSDIAAYNEKTAELTSTMVSARKFSDDLMNKSKADSDAMLAKAKTDSDEMMTKAQKESEELIARAQYEYNSAMEKAKAEAESILAKAKTDSDDMLAKARIDARVLLDKAEKESASIVGDAQIRRDTMKSEYEKLCVRTADFKNQLLDMYKVQVSSINNIPLPQANDDDGDDNDTFSFGRKLLKIK
ncbi:MAG: DivIVA domain-containing protein [Eubacteriales bacterium]|nr:DivIVA domain-containing protein [Eubacteriales bacterium]